MAQKIVNAKAGQDILVVVDGQVVLVLKAKPVSLSGTGQEFYNRHEYVGHGITVEYDDWYNQKYIGQAAAGMSLIVKNASVDSFVKSGISY